MYNAEFAFDKSNFCGAALEPSFLLPFCVRVTFSEPYRDHRRHTTWFAGIIVTCGPNGSKGCRPAAKQSAAKDKTMFSVVGLTLDEISSGSLPQLHLANVLDNRMTKSNFKYAEKILVYTTAESDTQALVARTKYRQQGQFLVFLYFNDAAVEACKEIGIPLRILDRIDECGLPSRRSTVLERPYLAPVSK